MSESSLSLGFSTDAEELARYPGLAEMWELGKKLRDNYPQQNPGGGCGWEELLAIKLNFNAEEIDFFENVH